ncbi:N-acetyltransferase family protein [Asticcacaulis sp.]|uniref:GNAT family N-acetyltransferase n=1 Tax=Asticcacaulis sp. TaxID=1872648 RepID=UPI003F7B71E7
MSYKIRPSSLTDEAGIHLVYRATARQGGGLLRREDEITDAYIRHNLENSLRIGISLVAEREDGLMLAEIHAWPSETRQLGHCLTNLTVAVDSAAQGRGIGRALFEHLIAAAKDNPKFRIIELYCREDNRRAIDLYQSLGFVFEGRLKGRVWQGNGRPYLDDLLMALYLTADA